jgi:hypothetical protein
MKVLKSLRRKKPRAARAEKVFAGFVRTLGKLCPSRGPTRAQPRRSRA